MVNSDVTDIKRLNRRSHCRDRRRLLALAQGRHGDIDELAEHFEARQKLARRPDLFDQPNIRIV